MSAFSLSSLILGLATIFFSVIAYQSDRKNDVNRYWFYFSIPFAAWSLSLYFVTSAASISAALKWQYVLDLAAVWIPSAYFAFITKLLRYKQSYTKNALYALSAAFSVFSFSRLFKEGMVQKFDFFWINPGSLYSLFPIFFGATVLLSVVHILFAIQKTKAGSSYRSQLKNTLIVCLIGFMAGGTNFFPQFFNIYPFGNYVVILYIVVMVYGVIRYDMLSRKVLTAQIFASALVLVSLVEIILAEGLRQIVYKMIIFTLVSFFSWRFIKSVKEEVKVKEELEIEDRELLKKNTELNRISAEKTEFVSLASHQIRGPLTSIKGYISLLREEELGPVSKEAKDALLIMEQSCTTLASVVNDYLDITRIEQGRMHYDFANVDVRALLKECMTELQPSFEHAGLQCVDRLPKGDQGLQYNVRADRTKLKQVLMNLIDNSIKYTPKGSVTISALRKNDGMVRIEIKDTGVGISPEVMPKLFMKFSRAPDASEANIMGTGLGLFIAKVFIEAHEGYVYAESEGVGKGSMFVIELKGM